MNAIGKAVLAVFIGLSFLVGLPGAAQAAQNDYKIILTTNWSTPGQYHGGGDISVRLQRWAAEPACGPVQEILERRNSRGGWDYVSSIPRSTCSTKSFSTYSQVPKGTYRMTYVNENRSGSGRLVTVSFAIRFTTK